LTPLNCNTAEGPAFSLDHMLFQTYNDVVEAVHLHNDTSLGEVEYMVKQPTQDRKYMMRKPMQERVVPDEPPQARVGQ